LPNFTLNNEIPFPRQKMQYTITYIGLEYGTPSN